MGPSTPFRSLVILSVVFAATALGSTTQDVPADAEANDSEARVVQETKAAGEKGRVAEPADVAAPADAQPAPGQIIIKPTGRKRVSRVGVAPPPPEVDYRVLARGDQPKGCGPYIYYPVHYIPTYSYCGSYYGGYYGGYYGDCHRYSSYDYGRPYCP